MGGTLTIRHDRLFFTSTASAWNVEDGRSCRARCWVSEGMAARLPSVAGPSELALLGWGDGWLVVV